MQICRKHELCRFIQGKELSAENVGSSLKLMHKEIEKVIFEDLLHNNRFPRELCGRICLIYDNINCNEPGYWAFSDQINIELVRECSSWSFSTVLEKNGVINIDYWCKKAKSILLTINNAIHLSGGGPWRGTELGAMYLRNTHVCKRAIFISGEELKILPKYNKTRSVRRGQMEFISRSVDSLTSYLLRVYYLFVYLLMFFHSRCTIREIKTNLISGGRNVNNGDKSDLNKFFLEVVELEKTSEAIGHVLKRHGIPLRFSMYRHWQRSYVKMKYIREKTSDKCATEIAIYEEKISTDETTLVEQFAVIQGGHSINTERYIYGLIYNPSEISQERHEMFRKVSLELQNDWYSKL